MNSLSVISITRPIIKTKGKSNKKSAIMISQSTNVLVITIHGEILDRIGKCRVIMDKQPTSQTMVAVLFNGCGIR